MKSLSFAPALAMLLPYAMSISDSSDSYTSLELGGGAGSYAEVSRDCEGNVMGVTDVPYTEAGGEIKHHFSDFQVAVAAGTTSGERGDISASPMTYITPTVGWDGRYVGLDLGWLFPIGPNAKPLYTDGSGLAGFPAGGLRLGRRDRVHISANIARNVPIYTGGGLVDVNLGFPIGESGSLLRVGISAYPYDALGFSAQGIFVIESWLAVKPRALFAPGESFEYSFGASGVIVF